MRPSLEHEDLREQLFDREARVASAIHHPNVVELFEFGQELEHKYLAMEYVRGRDLSHLVRAVAESPVAPVPPDIGLTIIMKAAAGLGHAHRLVDPSTGLPLAIVHRDISPGNVMVGYDGQVKVLDFGVARMNESNGMQTQSGTLRGKFAYMSPEQTVGSGVDARSDVFSLGTVLYELLTGSNPFRARTPLATLERVQRVRPVPPSRSNRNIAREVDEILARCLAKDPKRRFVDAGELYEALATLLSRIGAAPDEAIADLMRARFTWERQEEDKELEEEEEGALLIEVVDFAIGSEDRALDAPNVAVSEEEIAEPSVIASRPAQQEEAAKEEDAFGVFDSADEVRTVAQPSPFSTPFSAASATGNASWPESPALTPTPVPALPPIESAMAGEPSKSTNPRGKFEVVRGEVGRTTGNMPPQDRGSTVAWTSPLLEQGAGEDTDGLLRALADTSGANKTARPKAAGRSFPIQAFAIAAALIAVALGAMGWWMATEKETVSAKSPKKIAPVSIAVEPPSVSLTTAASPPPVIEAGPLPAGEIAADDEAEEEEEDDEPPPRLRPSARATPSPSSSPKEPKETREPREPREKRRPVLSGKRAAPTGFLNVGAKPWAEIEIDGKKWPYQTPQAGIELAVGKHTIKLTNRDLGISKTQVVHIKSGAYKTVSVDMRAD